jgi:aminomethyltransferase
MMTTSICGKQGDRNMKKTILHNLHASIGARMTTYAGFDMPVQYEGVLKEHRAARERAAIFDTCHMGELRARGPGAVADLERVLTCDVADMAVGACRYGLICNEAGGVIDDQIIYRMADNEFMLVVNAATGASDYEWVKSHISGDTKLENISKITSKIDLQGPDSPHIAASLMKLPIDGLKYYRFMKNFYRDREVIISRTGYTGEIGFEIYCQVDIARELWSACLECGAEPAGLGARDLLRLEMGLPLYGNELTTDRNAAQSGFDYAISRKKEFIGSKHVLDEAAADQLLRGIVIEGRRSAHEGDAVLNRRGTWIGEVTSGCFSPMLGNAVALAYIEKDYAEIGTVLTVTSGNAELPGTVSQLPFYKNGTARADINLYL